MSNRANAQRYSQSVRQPDVSDVDLFGVKERRRNREADAQLQRDKSWLEAQQAYEQALIDFETAKQAEIERLRGEETRTTEQTRGGIIRENATHEQQLKRALLEYELSKQMELEQFKGQDIRETERAKGDIEQGRMSHEQVLKLMEAKRIPYTPENFAAFNAGVSANMIGAASKTSSFENELLGTPQGKDMYTNMLMANMAEPGVKNSAALRTTAGPGEIVTVPQGRGFANGTPGLMEGPRAQETTTMVGGVKDEETGRMMFQSPVTTRSFAPGSVRYPAVDFEDNSGDKGVNYLSPPKTSQAPALQTKPQEGGGVPVQDILNSVLGGGQPAVGQDPYIMKLRSMFGF